MDSGRQLHVMMMGLPTKVNRIQNKMIMQMFGGKSVYNN